MKKMIAFILAVICLLSFASCSPNDDESKDPFEPNNTTASAETNNTTITPSTTEPSSAVDGDEAIKEALIDKYGIPFRLWKTEGMSLCEFTLGETNSKREYHHSMEGSFTQEPLSWEINNGEVVITGAWDETFVLNIEEDQATSKTDGTVYSILESD